MESKSEIRKWAREFAYLKQEASSLLVEKLRANEIYAQSKNILIFYPLKNEINLLPLLDDSDKNFYLPKIDNENLLCCPYAKGDELCFSCFKTQEPISQAVNNKILDLIIVPALCCDKKGYRIGYGGGFYDRFLQDCKAKTIVCIPQTLLVETIYPAQFDIPVDMVITENAIYS